MRSHIVGSIVSIR